MGRLRCNLKGKKLKLRFYADFFLRMRYNFSGHSSFSYPRAPGSEKTFHRKCVNSAPETEISPETSPAKRKSE